MRGFNEAKLLALGLLATRPATAREIADYLDISAAGASSYLRKLHLQGLLGRRGAGGLSQEHTYYINTKGIDRLGWLERERTYTEPAHLMSTDYRGVL